jgi:hypothetical protein
MAPKTINQSVFKNHEEFALTGLTISSIAQACDYVHSTIDALDQTLISVGADRLSKMVELANLSSMIGNLFGAGIAQFSDGALKRNRPHTYPDLLALNPGIKNIEIKVALENNKPKGHLAKAGYYLTCRYVLVEEDGTYVLPSTRKRIVDGERGTIPVVWEVRFGWLDLVHFNSSNTEGDSGKTATVNKEGMAQLAVVYCDLSVAPYTKGSPSYKAMNTLFNPAAPPTLF